jgi:hypothetical protein
VFCGEPIVVFCGEPIVGEFHLDHLDDLGLCACARNEPAWAWGGAQRRKSGEKRLEAFSTMASAGKTRKAGQTYRQGECGAERHP